MVGATTWQIGTLAMLTWDRPVTFALDAGSRYHEVVLAALALFYPTGRRRGRPVALVIAMLTLLVAGSVLKLLAQQPSRWGCVECPANPTALVTSESFFVESIDAIGRALGVCVAAVAVVVVIRWREGRCLLGERLVCCRWRSWCGRCSTSRTRGCGRSMR